MSLNQRPISVTGVAWLLIAVGIGMFVFYVPELRTLHSWSN
jgi:hypothetical protein